MEPNDSGKDSPKSNPKDFDPSKPEKERPETPSWTRWALLVGALVIAGVFILPSIFSNDDAQDITYNEFLTSVEDGQVASAEVNNGNGDVKGKYTNGNKYKTTGPLELTESNSSLLRENVPDVTFRTPTSSFWSNLLQILLPIGLLVLFFWWMARRTQGQVNGIMSIGRSKAKAYAMEKPSTTFDDVAGHEGVKKEIKEVVDFLSDPGKFAEIGARVPKGILLVGPPGTGKTLLARAVAGEAKVLFLSVTGSDFMEMFVGVGASRVRDLFQTARKTGRAIIFIDEIDSLGRKRGAGLGGGHDEREQTLNQMLSEMDGFEDSEGVVVMAATNRPDILDPALLRPGRFDRQVVVPLPELQDRLDILKVHTKGKRLNGNVDLNVVSRGTPGMSGADLANLINEAALYAVRDGKGEIEMSHFEYARDRVLLGQKRESMALSEKERKTVAYHEAGHAVCAAMLPYTDPLHKVTIIPSGFALGVTMQLPEEERHIYHKDYIENNLVVRMGGRVAEELVFGVISTGANDDLVGATGMARKMVREWGMSEKVGPMAWGNQSEVFLGDEIVSTREYSDSTAMVIDEEVKNILNEQHKKCKTLLRKNRKALDLVAEALLEKETILGEEVELLIKTSQNGASANGADKNASGGAAESADESAANNASPKDAVPDSGKIGSD